MIVVAQKGVLTDQELRNDALFKEMIEYYIRFAEQTNEAFNKEGSGADVLKQRIQELQNDRISSSDEMLRKIDDAFGYDLKYKFSEYYYLLQRNWPLIKAKFGDKLNDDYIKTEAESAGKSILGISDGAGCRNKAGYITCAAAATSAAIIAHAGCVATIFGIPACVALVGSMQVAAINECYRNWCL